MNRFITIFALCMLLYSCSKRDLTDTIAFENIKEFSGFPASFKISDGEEITPASIGNINFKIIDSLMIISTSEPKNSWKLFLLPSLTPVGQMINVGPGPNEFNFLPIVTEAVFSRNNGHIGASISDNIKGKIHDIDITASVDSGKLIASEQPDTLLTKFTVLARYYPQGEKFFIAADPANNRIVRSVYDGQKRVASSNIDYLNHYSVKSMDKLGLLMPTPIMNSGKGRIVEVSNLVPQINIYDVYDDFNLTLAPDGQLYSYAQFMDQAPNDISEYYAGAKGYEDYFVANKKCDDGNELEFFDWDGNPLIMIKVPHRFTFFDIDLTNRTLYTLNLEDESMHRYDINESLNSINK